MIVDLQRNDLGRVASPGAVRWASWQVETFPKVQHMVSSVEGSLSSTHDVWDALAAVFPGGSITGCPKTVTIAAIDELENFRRSSWTGSIGFVDLRTGNGQWNILIRTVEVTKCENDGGLFEAEVKAGGGLTINSDPEAEVAEAKLKVAPLLRAAFGVRQADSIDQSRNATVAVHSKSMHYEIHPINARVQSLLRGWLRSCTEIPSRPLGTWVAWAPDQHPSFTNASSLDRPRVLFVENLDSFSLNIVHLCTRLGAEVVVLDGRAAPATMQRACETLKATHVLLGPGPGRPEMYPSTMRAAQMALQGELGVPLLGICLGHQAIGVCNGWNLMPSPLGAVHGLPEEIHHDRQGCFGQLASPSNMMRYNSLVLQKPKSVHDDKLLITAWDEQRALIMGIQHTGRPVFGVQFHPESVGSSDGEQLLNNFLRVTGVPRHPCCRM